MLPPGEVLELTGTPSADNLAIVDGTADGRRSLDGGFARSPDGPVLAEFAFDYDPAYERGSSLPAISGQYSESDSSGVTVTYSIDDQGQVSGSDTAGCTATGDISLLDMAYNMYAISLTLSGCAPSGFEDGDYTGLAATLDFGGAENDTLVFFAEGASAALAVELPRIQ